MFKARTGVVERKEDTCTFHFYRVGIDYGPLELMSLLEGVNEQNVKKVKQFLQEGCEINKQDERGGFTALMRACLLGNKDIVKLLLKKDPIIDIQNNLNKSALMFACEGGFKDIAIHLVKYRDASITLRDNWGKSAVDYADERIDRFGSDLIAAARRLPPPKQECDLCHNPVMDVIFKMIRLFKILCDIPEDEKPIVENDDW